MSTPSPFPPPINRRRPSALKRAIVLPLTRRFLAYCCARVERELAEANRALAEIRETVRRAGPYVRQEDRAQVTALEKQVDQLDDELAFLHFRRQSLAETECACVMDKASSDDAVKRAA
jgi:hypothetical protein